MPVVATDETGRLAQSFNSMVEGLDERERLREAFGAYVDPGLAAARALLDGAELSLKARPPVTLKGKRDEVKLWAPTAPAGVAGSPVTG